MKKYSIIVFSALFCLLSVLVPDELLAIQSHGESEGIVVHQMGHFFFFVSMGAFIYWLREGRLVGHAGWRYIMLFAMFMGVWNLDVLLMHYLDEQGRLIEVTKTGPWTVMITNVTGSDMLSMIYYLGKLDHLLCVPALFFLYLGLKRIKGSLESNSSGRETK
jgi:hypothetical protein